MNRLRIGLLAKDLLPDLEISRDVRFAVLLPLDAGKQHKKVGALPEDTSRRGGLKIGAAKIFVKTLQASAFGEVLTLRLTDAGQDIEVRSQPAVILGEQAGNELARVVRTRSDQISPGDLGPGSSRDNHAAGANAYLAAVKIKGGGVGEQSSEAWGTLQCDSCFGIVLGQSPV